MTLDYDHGLNRCQEWYRLCGKENRASYEALSFAIDERWEENGTLLGVMLRAGKIQIGLNQDDWKEGRDRTKGIGVRLSISTPGSVDEIAGTARGLYRDGHHLIGVRPFNSWRRKLAFEWAASNVGLVETTFAEDSKTWQTYGPMTSTYSAPTTLLGLIGSAPAERTAVIVPEQNIRVSYGSLRKQVQDVANQLAAAGIRRGDRVGMALPNGLPAIVSFLAASMAGTAAPLNPGYREDEFTFFLEDTNAKVLLLPPDGAAEARRAAGDTVPILPVQMDAAGVVSLGDIAGNAKADTPDVNDVALILHTSGSTGRPKRVPLSHANLSISSGNVARSYALTPDDVSLCVMPLFHVHGLVASTLATLATGGTVVVPGKFNPLSFWRTAQEHGATWYSAVPTLHQLLLARVEPGAATPAGAAKLRFIRSCSASLPPQVMHDLEAAFGAPVLEAYGMTEAAHQMTSNPLPPGERRAGSVGCGTDVRISIMDGTGKHLGPGERGEVCISGPNVTKGYENNPEANASGFFGEWFRTGDQGILDEKGYLTLTGRLKELINRGGEKISPREIDEVLLTHPAVAEAVCFGVPHPTWGEEVAAAVVLRADAGSALSAADLMAHCKGSLSAFKCPKQIHITETIPRTATGKIQRRVVAEAFGNKQ